MCPKSSLSMSSDGIAAQLTSTKVFFARDELLAGAVLAGDEDAGGRRGDALDLFDEGADAGRAADDLVAAFDGVAERLAEAGVFVGEVGVFERVLEEEEHAVGVERLLEEVVGAGLGGFDGRLDRAVAGDHDDRGARVELAQAPEGVEAVHPGHLDVEEDEVRAEAVVLRDAFGGARGGADLVAFVLEELAECGADAGFVVDDEDASGGGGGHGVFL
jgi:hypothetical protein